MQAVCFALAFATAFHLFATAIALLIRITMQHLRWRTIGIALLGQALHWCILFLDLTVVQWIAD